MIESIMNVVKYNKELINYLETNLIFLYSIFNGFEPTILNILEHESIKGIICMSKIMKIRRLLLSYFY